MFGISEQAYYKRIESDKVKVQQREFVLIEVDKIRKKTSHTGTRKLYYHLLPTLIQNDIKMGRGALFDLLRYNRLLVKKTKDSISLLTQKTFITHHLTELKI